MRRQRPSLGVCVASIEYTSSIRETTTPAAPFSKPTTPSVAWLRRLLAAVVSRGAAAVRFCLRLSATPPVASVGAVFYALLKRPVAMATWKRRLSMEKWVGKVSVFSPFV